MDIGSTHPALYAWIALSIPASTILFILNFPNPISLFQIFWAVIALLGLYTLSSGSVDEVTEDSTDWNEGAEPETLMSWTLIGLVGVFVVSLLFGLFLTGSLTSGIWVPQDLLGLSAMPVFLFAFVSDVFGTWFSVVPGEESLKLSFAPLHMVFGDRDLPYALQPATLVGSGVWAIEHVIKGQMPLIFAVSVFFVSIVMDSATAQTGTPLTKFLIHALFNTVLLAFSFFSGGFLSIIPS